MALLESLVVAVIVLASAAFSAWRLLSVRLRLRLLDFVGAAFRPAGGSGARAWMTRLHARTLAQLSGGCGSCSQAAGGLSAPALSANRTPAAPRR